MWSWHCNSTLQEYGGCYRPWTILLLFQMASKEQMHLYCCLGFYSELFLFAWLFIKDEPRNKRLVESVSWQLQYGCYDFGCIEKSVSWFVFSISRWKSLLSFSNSLYCLCLNFNKMQLEHLWSLTKKAVASLVQVSVIVNNEESADGCLAPLLADSFVVKTISCLVGEGGKERTGSEVGETDV